MNPETNDVPGFVEGHSNELHQQFQQVLQLALEQQRVQLLEQFRQNGGVQTHISRNDVLSFLRRFHRQRIDSAYPIL
jgi:hypothetical protein